MKKLIVCLTAYLIVAFTFKVASADESNPTNDAKKIESHISGIYKQIDFGKSETLPYDVFSKAYHGYLNLKNAGKLNNEKDVISICNFSLPSTANRLWIIDLRAKKVLFNTYVAHGQGSGEDMAVSFSNKLNSHQSSLGFYVTSDIYQGEHGTSLHLMGMDQGFNDAAMERDIVVHAADYVCDKYIQQNERLGRSWGCPAVSPALAMPIINTIKEGTCLFIYYPDPNYLSSAYWLNKRTATMPEGIDPFGDLLPQPTVKPKVKLVEYWHRGKLDSVVRVPL